MRGLDCTPDPDYIAKGAKGSKKEKLEAEAQLKRKEEQKEQAKKEYEESKEGINVNPLELEPKPSAAQSIFREELDAIRNRAEDLEYQVHQNEIAPDQSAAARRLMNREASVLKIRGMNKNKFPEETQEGDYLTGKLGAKMTKV